MAAGAPRAKRSESLIGRTPAMRTPPGLQDSGGHGFWDCCTAGISSGVNPKLRHQA
jgi:hypothetical protein